MDTTAETQAWAPNPDVDGDWLEAVVVSRGEDGTVVLKTVADGAEHTCPADKLNLMNVLPEQGVEDMARLNYLHEPALLNNLRHRFALDHVYTYTAKICIAVNPFDWQVSKPLYAEEVLRKYRGREMSELPPHVYAIAEDAYQKILDAEARNGNNQSVLVSGESGAGKTEAVKIMMNYLAAVSRAGETNLIAQQVLASNPLLEAFGNAKTSRNNNSSRFGKFIEIQFDQAHKMSGAHIHIYLLEKSRIAGQAQGERNYHVFYQLLAGMPAAELAALHLDAPLDSFGLVNQSGCVSIPGQDEAAEFARTRTAMGAVGLSEAEQRDTTRAVAAVLLLAQLAFEPDDEAHATLGGEALQRAATLLGAEAGEVSAALCTRQLVTRDDIITVPLSIEQAVDSRDALGKALYARLFEWLVQRCNAKLVDTHEPYAFIGILDIFGFECFVTNSFEQLCINYANERLHNFFLMRVFEVEIELYRMQSLEVPPLDYPDNAKVIELLEKRPTGIFPALDSQCKMPKATDLTFAAALHKAHKEQPHFSTLSMAHMRGVKLRDEESFVVRHYAADVCYGAAGFLEKNSDALSPEFERKLRASSHPFVRQLVTGAAAKVSADGKGMTTSRGGGPGSLTRRNAPGNMSFRRNSGEGAKGQPPQQTSVSAKFLKSLTQLMKEIATTHPYFVRCLKPNHALKPGAFNAAMILRQLQCSGTVECVKLMQSGYPNRAPYADLHARFRTALPAEMSAKPPKDFVKELLLGTDCQPGEYQMGQDMVFFKGSKGAVLQELMLTPKEHIAAKLLAKLKEKEPSSASIPILEKYIAQRVEERKLARAKLTAAVHAAIDLFEWNKVHLAIVREKRAASVKMQAIQRGKKARRELEEMKATGKALEVKQLELKEEAERRASEAAEEEPLPLSLEDALTKAQGSLEPIDEEAQEAAEHEAKWFAQIAAKGGKRYHRFLMCKGVEWGFQYHNFYGDWELDYETPLCNDRPHYKHNTMYGGYAHLFHCMDPHYHVPRWVIGPAPGNENGWAFCESDAPTPWENTACWISWDGFEWHTCKNFRFVPKEHELDGLSDEEGFEDEAEMEAYQAEQQRLQEEEAAARRARAEAEKKAAPAANGGGPAAGQVNNQAHKPTPRSSTPKAVAAGGPKAAALGSQERASKGSRGGSSPSSKKAALKAADEKKEKSGKKPSKKEEKPKEEKPKEEKPKKEETRKKLGAGLFGGKRKK